MGDSCCKKVGIADSDEDRDSVILFMATPPIPRQDAKLGSIQAGHELSTGQDQVGGEGVKGGATISKGMNMSCHARELLKKGQKDHNLCSETLRLWLLNPHTGKKLQHTKLGTKRETLVSH